MEASPEAGLKSLAVFFAMLGYDASQALSLLLSF